jgi:hypothetical protein
MNILTLNIGKKGSWAFYNSTACDKITWGRFVYKRDPEEGEDAPARRFENILENKYYHNDNIDKVFFRFCDNEKKMLKKLTDTMRKFCERNNIPYEKLEYKNADIELIKKKYATLQDDIEAEAVAMIDSAIDYKLAIK